MMKSILKFIALYSTMAILLLFSWYTGLMGLFFSFMGSWADEPILMVGYLAVFLVSSSLLFLLARRQPWINAMVIEFKK